MCNKEEKDDVTRIQKEKDEKRPLPKNQPVSANW